MESKSVDAPSNRRLAKIPIKVQVLLDHEALNLTGHLESLRIKCSATNGLGQFKYRKSIGFYLNTKRIEGFSFICLENHF